MLPRSDLVQVGGAQQILVALDASLLRGALGYRPAEIESKNHAERDHELDLRCRLPKVR
jgi:hypothetical protein